MKIIVLITIFALSHGKPVDLSNNASILIFKNVLEPSESYNYFLETSGGTIRQESGKLSDRGGSNVLLVDGYYSYLDETGTRQDIQYIADENGYIVQSTVASLQPLFANKNDPSVLKTVVANGGFVSNI